MPTYLYCVVNPDGSDGEAFEVFQPMSEAALTQHPENGRPVRRVPVASQMQFGSDASRLSNKNLDRLGFDDGFALPVLPHAGGNALNRDLRAQPPPELRDQQQKADDIAEKPRNEEKKPRKSMCHGLSRSTLLQG